MLPKAALPNRLFRKDLEVKMEKQEIGSMMYYRQNEEKIRKQYFEALKEKQIPIYCHNGIVGYVLYGHEFGGFLKAVFANDLKDSISRADESNMAAIHQYAQLLYNDVPAGCHGSKAKVEQWIKRGGLLRIGEG